MVNVRCLAELSKVGIFYHLYTFNSILSAPISWNASKDARVPATPSTPDTFVIFRHDAKDNNMTIFGQGPAPALLTYKCQFIDIASHATELRLSESESEELLSVKSDGDQIAELCLKLRF